MNNNKFKNAYDEVKLKQTVKKLESGLSQTILPKSQWIETFRTEESPCDKICNGKKRIKINYACMRGKNQIDEKYCTGKEKRTRYIEQSCNTHCRLM
jgi:hypothetical protein